MNGSIAQAPLSEQVTSALSIWIDLHKQQEDAAAARDDLKYRVGSNEAERKTRKAETPADEYAGYVLHLQDAETDYKSKQAAAERAEKQLNVLRELLNHETAVIANAASGTFSTATTHLYNAVDAWRRSTGTKPLPSEIRRRWAEQPVPAGDVDDGVPF